MHRLCLIVVLLVVGFLVRAYQIGYAQIGASVYTSMDEKQNLSTLVWVNDMLIMGTRKVVDPVKVTLKRAFHMKDLCGVAHFLSITIIRDRKCLTIQLCQQNRVAKVLQQFERDHPNCITIPAD
jgi:hypothetical protein